MAELNLPAVFDPVRSRLKDSTELQKIEVSQNKELIAKTGELLLSSEKLQSSTDNVMIRLVESTERMALILQNILRFHALAHARDIHLGRIEAQRLDAQRDREKTKLLEDQREGGGAEEETKEGSSRLEKVLSIFDRLGKFLSIVAIPLLVGFAFGIEKNLKLFKRFGDLMSKFGKWLDEKFFPGFSGLLLVAGAAALVFRKALLGAVGALIRFATGLGLAGTAGAAGAVGAAGTGGKGKAAGKAGRVMGALRGGAAAGMAAFGIASLGTAAVAASSDAASKAPAAAGTTKKAKAKKPPTAVAPPAVKNPLTTKGAKMIGAVKGIAGFLMKTPVLASMMAVVELNRVFTEANADREAGKINDEQYRRIVTVAIGKAVGGVGGATLGAMLGATIGTAAFPLGGGAVGGIVGGLGGWMAGEEFGAHFAGKLLDAWAGNGGGGDQLSTAATPPPTSSAASADAGLGGAAPAPQRAAPTPQAQLRPSAPRAAGNAIAGSNEQIANQRAVAQHSSSVNNNTVVAPQSTVQTSNLHNHFDGGAGTRAHFAAHV